MLDQDHVRRHHHELAHLIGRFVVDHMVRLRGACDGDVLAGIVLGSIAQHNLRRFYEEVVPRSGETLDALIARGAHLPHLRSSNAMSVSASTGIPRETVRRKIKWLAARGWVRHEGRDKLYVTEAAGLHFADFDVQSVDRFHVAAVRVASVVADRGRSEGGGAPPASVAARLR